MKSLFLSLCSLSLITATIHGQPNDPANAVHQQLFGEGVISTPFREWTTTFTPDGQTVYFSRGNLRYAIIYSERVNGKWQKPKLAQDSASTPAKYAHIWGVERINKTTWSSPVLLDSPINLVGVSSWYPSESEDGNFYFHSGGRRGGQPIAYRFEEIKRHLILIFN